MEDALVSAHLVEQAVDKMEGIEDKHGLAQILARFGAWLSFEMWERILPQCPQLVCRLPKEYANINFYTSLVRKNYKIYAEMFDDLKTEEQTLIYLEGSITNTMYIPSRLLTDTVITRIVEKFIDPTYNLTIQLSHVAYFPTEILLKLIPLHPYFLGVIDPNYTTYEDWVKWSKTSHAVWSKIPKEYRTGEIIVNYCCVSGVNDENLLHITKSDPELITLEIAFAIVREKPFLYCSLPTKVKESSYELALLYARKQALSAVKEDFPEEFLTRELKHGCFFNRNESQT